MHHREILVRHYTAAIPWLRTLPYTHRYFRMYWEMFNKDSVYMPKERSKNTIITQIADKLRMVRAMTNEQFDAYTADNQCVLCVMLHDRQATVRIETHFFMGGIKLVDHLIESEDGSTAELKQKVYTFDNDEWVCRGFYDEPEHEDGCCDGRL